jgi:hypothetical protein
MRGLDSGAEYIYFFEVRLGAIGFLFIPALGSETAEFDMSKSEVHEPDGG